MISVSRLLFQSSEVPFTALALHPHEIGEKVYLETKDSRLRLEVSDRHWVVCSDPFIIAVWLNEKVDAGPQRLLVTLDSKSVGYAEMDFFDRRNMPEGELVLFKCTKAVCRDSSFIHRHLMLWYLRLTQKEDAAGNIANYGVAYSYPRNVVLVSFRKDDYFNIFPMDFQGRMPGTNRCLFGLRKTNKTLDKIVEQKRIAVCEVPATKKDIIYQLGKHHGSAPPSIDALPFSCGPSERFSFPIPIFAMAYTEVELDDFHTIGSHMLMVGNIVNHVAISSPDKQLYHIHCMHAGHRQP